ncbi:MAG: DoxX family protein [Deltaproteobacteria bacterium]|nr:DoxX family protein [Deltaproteobacteria bacterium]
MKLNEPIGSAEWAGLILRLPLSLFMFIAALKKIDNLEAFIETVKSFNIVKNEFANITIGFLFPWIEMFVSILLFLGLWINLAVILGILLLGSIIYAFGILPEGTPFNKDIILVSLLFALMFTGSGRFGIDFSMKKNS